MWISFLRFKFFAFAPTRQSHVHIQRSLFTFMYKRVSEWEIIQNKIQKCVINDALTLALLHMLQFFGCWTWIKVRWAHLQGRQTRCATSWVVVCGDSNATLSLAFDSAFFFFFFSSLLSVQTLVLIFFVYVFVVKLRCAFYVFVLNFQLQHEIDHQFDTFMCTATFFASLSCLLALLVVNCTKLIAREFSCVFDYCYIG